MLLCEIQSIGETTEYIVPATSLLSFTIQSAGISLAKTGFEFVRHQPNFALVMLSLEGQGEVWLNGDWNICHKNQMYLAPAQTLHAYRTKESSWDVCWLTLSSTHTFAVGEPVLLSCDPEPLRAAVWGMYRESIGAGEPETVRAWLNIVQRYVERLIQVREDDAVLWRVWQSVESDLARRWTLPDLARLAHMSDEKLRRLCLARTGRSPMRHLAFLRMNRAASLLLRTNWTIERIAREVGYNNAFAFSVAFRQWMKKSPSDYRRDAA